MGGRRRRGNVKAATDLGHLEQPPEVLRALARRELHLDQARHDVNAFNEYVFEKPDGTPAKQGRIHREWHALADAHPRVMVIAPRLHWKTGQFVGRLMWKVGQDVNEVTKIICQSDKKAIKRLAFIRDHFKNNDSLHRVFPHLVMDRAVEWNKHMITLDRRLRGPEPTIEALGITSSGTGDRASGIFADDVVDRRNAITLPRVRESIKDSWDDWLNLLPPNGWLWYVATLWHNSDLTHHLMENPEYAVAMYRITMPELGSEVTLPDGTVRVSDEPLWGTRDGGPWSRANLDARRGSMTSRQFARSFSNKPMADSEVKVKPDWIRFHHVEPPRGWPLVVSLDLASAQHSTADFTGVVPIAVNPDKPQLKVTKDVVRAKLNFPEKVELVRWLHRTLRPEYIVIELAAGGRELMEYMLRNYALPLRGMKPRGGKGARLDAVTPFIEQGIVTFDQSLQPSPERTRERGCLVTELTSYPIGATDDLLDAFTQGVTFATRVYDHFYRDEDDWEYEDEPTTGIGEGDEDDYDDNDSEVLLV